jgi:hypothetical protein
LLDPNHVNQSLDIGSGQRRSWQKVDERLSHSFPPHFQSWPFQNAGGCELQDFTVPGFYLVFRRRIIRSWSRNNKCRTGTAADPRIICSHYQVVGLLLAFSCVIWNYLRCNQSAPPRLLLLSFVASYRVCVTPPISLPGGASRLELSGSGGRRWIILMALTSDECVNEGRSEIYDFTTFIRDRIVVRT